MLDLIGRHRLAEADGFPQCADGDNVVLDGRLDVEGGRGVAVLALNLFEADAKIGAVGAGLVGGVLDLQRFDEADVELGALLVDEEAEEPFAVAVEAADGLFLAGGPLVALAKIFDNLQAVVGGLLGDVVLPAGNLVRVAAADGVGDAIACRADRVGVGLREDAAAGADLAELDLVDVGPCRRSRIDQRAAVGRAWVWQAAGERAAVGFVAVAEVGDVGHVDDAVEIVAVVLGKLELAADGA